MLKFRQNLKLKLLWKQILTNGFKSLLKQLMKHFLLNIELYCSLFIIRVLTHTYDEKETFKNSKFP